VAVGLLFSPGIWRIVAILTPTAGYSALTTIMALTAVFSSRPHRRKAALEVLHLLIPGRRRIIPGSRRSPRRL
jgi:hypothetical protein